MDSQRFKLFTLRWENKENRSLKLFGLDFSVYERGF